MGINVKGLIGTVAPWIATAMGGPMAGAAVSKLTGVLGLGPEAKQSDVEAALASGQMTGEQLLALKKADEEFKLDMEKLGFDHIEKLEQLAAEDRDSARKREMSVKDKTPMVLAFTLTAGFFGLLMFMLFKDVPKESHDILIAMIGVLGASFGAVITYYFGSSAGSDKKTELLAQKATSS